MQSPLTKAVILLLNLPGKDFLARSSDRSALFTLFSISEYRMGPLDSASRSLGSRDPRARHLQRRSRVAPAAPLPLARSKLRQISDDDEPRNICIRATQLTYLANIVEIPDGGSAPVTGASLVAGIRSGVGKLLKKYLGIAPDCETMARGVQAQPRETILDILEQIAGLDSIKNRVALGDFAHTFQHWLERSNITEDRRNVDGVMVLNATAARGLSFRALFVLGMNEGVFPRTIREDAFLRDHDREVLERDLGYKVSQKLTAFDEEKLLFTLLAGAARDRFYCSFQRTDESGRALAPSWYIDELKRALAASGRPCETINIPRSITEKAATAPFDRQDLLLPKELAIRLTLEAQDPTALIEASASLPALLYKQGRKVAAEIDQSGDRLLPYDGALADFAGYWKHFSERGLSPTALETYARCPFQFFARHVLGLEPLDRPEEILGPSPAQFGELGHEILNKFFHALIDGGYFTGSSGKVNVETVLQSIAVHAFADYQENNPVGYPLAWESLKEGILQLLRQVVTQDLSELAQSGFAPASLETAATARLPADWPEPLKGLLIRGRMDRIDRKDEALRVIDYKFKFGASPATQDKNLVRAALRGERLQPPFYYMLAQRWVEEQMKEIAHPAIEASFYFIAPRWPDGPLISSAYGSDGLSGKTGAETKQTIAYLAEGVRQGRFFINRGEYCGRCDAAPICRKNHPPSLWRAENDPVTEPHRALHKKDPNDEHEPSSD